MRRLGADALDRQQRLEGLALVLVQETIQPRTVLARLAFDMQARLAVETAQKTLGPDAELPVLIRTALKSLGK